MRIKELLVASIAINVSLLSGGFMTPRTLEEATAGTVSKIVYVGVGAASKTDTYQAYPLFMEQLSKQYPGLCMTINFDAEWNERSFSEELLSKRDPTLNKENFFIIPENLGLTSADKLRVYLDMILKRGGVVILGKFTGYASALELPLLYMGLLKGNPKNRLLFFSTLPTHNKATFYWWNGMPYSLYNDMLATEKILRLRQPARKEEQLINLKEGLAIDIERLFDEDTDKILDAEALNILQLPKEDSELMSDFASKSIEIPKTALETTSSMNIDIVNKADGALGIRNVSFLQEPPKPLGGLMTPRKLEEATAGTVSKIVYVGVGAASKTDTYQAYPLFMEQLSKQYPGLCRTINFNATGEATSKGSEKFLLKRDAMLNAQNFFIIAENLDLKVSAYKLLPFLSGVLLRGGVVILGKFTHYSSDLELPLLYMWLLERNPKFKNQVFLFSTLPTYKQATLYWAGTPYSLYNERIITERLLFSRYPTRNTWDNELSETLQKNGKALWKSDEEDKILNQKDEEILAAYQKKGYYTHYEVFNNDLKNLKILDAPQVSKETTRSLIIEVTKKTEGKKELFSISDVYFLKETLEDLHRSLQLINLMAQSS